MSETLRTISEADPYFKRRIPIGELFPLATGGGPLREGLAWCMIFGLIVATVLTLLVVPAMYALFVERLGMNAFSD